MTDQAPGTETAVLTEPEAARDPRNSADHAQAAAGQGHGAEAHPAVGATYRIPQGHADAWLAEREVSP